MNSIIINLDDNVDVNIIYNNIRDLYPNFKIEKRHQQKKKTTWEEIKKMYGIVRSDIDEKAELEESRRERFL